MIDFEREKKVKKCIQGNYLFNKSIMPFPKTVDKLKPPAPKENINYKPLVEEPKKELTPDEKIILAMSEYKKAERCVIVNFYTGGGPYRAGMMDLIYMGLLQKAA